MFCEIAKKLNSQNVGDTSQLYPYRSIIESLFNYCKETQETWFQCDSWTKNTNGNINDTAVNENNAGLNARAANFARSTLVKLIRVFIADVFYQNRQSCPNIDLYLKLMPSQNNFLCKSAALVQTEAQENK